MPAALVRIGLTGGIGSGKSTVARMLLDCGAEVIDADAISRQLTAPGGLAIRTIAAHFGSWALVLPAMKDFLWILAKLFYLITPT